MWPKAVWWAQWHAVDWDEALHSQKHTLLEPALKKSHAFHFSIFHLTAILTVLSNLFLPATLCLPIFLHSISDYILLLCLFHVCTSSSFMHSPSAHWRLAIPSSGQILNHITLMILCFHIHLITLKFNSMPRSFICYNPIYSLFAQGLGFSSVEQLFFLMRCKFKLWWYFNHPKQEGST